MAAKPIISDSVEEDQEEEVAMNEGDETPNSNQGTQTSRRPSVLKPAESNVTVLVYK